MKIPKNDAQPILAGHCCFYRCVSFLSFESSVIVLAEFVAQCATNVQSNIPDAIWRIGWRSAPNQDAVRPDFFFLLFCWLWLIIKDRKNPGG